MPKKKSSIYAKPSSPAHPSLSSSSKSITHLRTYSNPDVKSVNNRLQQLRLPRKGDGSRPFEAPPSHTVHPSLRSILQIPDAPSPRPRPGLRVAGGRRGPAGPRPPDSWLGMRSTDERKFQSVMIDHRISPALPGYDLPEPGTLLSSSLKQLARDWEFHVEYDQYYLATIPTRYKEVLLHFIALYRPCTIDRRGLETLFLDETELEGATGAVDLFRLDLTTSIGRSFSLKDLKTFFATNHKLAPTAGVADKNTDDGSQSPSVPESWDSVALLRQPLDSLAPRLATLTHLSLSCPSPNISWSHLLHHLLPGLPSQSLTHLSLAFWPFPTLTPNSLTATSPSPAGRIQAGGSNFYSSYDSDWTEPASILRRVARATLGLKWLDFTGNWPWMQALADEGFDWSGGGLWAELETLVVGQGWVPECFAASSSRNSGYEQRASPHPIHNQNNFNNGAVNENSVNNNDVNTQPSTSFWRRKHSFDSINLSIYDSCTYWEMMRSNPQGVALQEWAHNEHASLVFEQSIKSKLKQPSVLLPSVGNGKEDEDDWTTSTSFAASARPDDVAERPVASGSMKQEENGNRQMTSQRRKGIHFEREWNEKWVSDALWEFSKMEGEVLPRSARVWINANERV